MYIAIQKTRIATALQKKKNEFGELKLPDFETFCKTKVINDV